jgi:hypothetical protein
MPYSPMPLRLSLWEVTDLGYYRSLVSENVKKAKIKLNTDLSLWGKILRCERGIVTYHKCGRRRGFLRVPAIRVSIPLQDTPRFAPAALLIVLFRAHY